MKLTDLEERDENGFIILKESRSVLYDKKSYLAPLSYSIERITEYDIRHANISVMRQYSSVLSKTVLDKLDSLGNQRNIEFGKLMRDHPQGEKIKRDLAKGIIEAKRLLFIENNIKDEDVLSIKNDAVFIIGRRLKNTKFGHIEFVNKNEYNSFIRIGSLEFYYNTKTDLLSVKGISDEIIENEDHKKGMLKFIKTILKLLRKGNKDKLRDYLIEFSTDYKSLNLPFYYYRELNRDNIYRPSLQIDGYMLEFPAVNSNEILKDIVITYNYIYFILPLIQRFCW